GVRGDEVEQLLAEREAAHAQGVDEDALFRQAFERLVHRGAGRAVVDATKPRRLARWGQYGFRNQSLGVLELLLQPLHVVHVVRAGLGVAGVGVAARAAREVGALGG